MFLFLFFRTHSKHIIAKVSMILPFQIREINRFLKEESWRVYQVTPLSRKFFQPMAQVSTDIVISDVLKLRLVLSTHGQLEAVSLRTWRKRAHHLSSPGASPERTRLLLASRWTQLWASPPWVHCPRVGNRWRAELILRNWPHQATSHCHCPRKAPRWWIFLESQEAGLLGFPYSGGPHHATHQV